ncbi:UNVERIFIED_CONTAM: Retrovirus-related Pol polyprotein from transposon RE1 [Sesamum radiatum]|uniref:Retrovirus-related Pol polyprotein from transposon RE1 n=1 Tax=Sesamum radiatum TaxID=300843 RepID=A0AAW2LQ82_SESRA
MECFSPVAKAVTVRVFLAIASAKRWLIHQLDVNNAFLHGYLDEEFLALIVYVDDILVTGTSESLIHEMKNYVDTLFTIKDLGYAKFFLGLEIARSPFGTFVSQQKYATDLVKTAGLAQARCVYTPLPPGIKLTQGAEGLRADLESYSRLVGRLYLGFTWLDLSHAVQQLSQYVQHPTQQHWDATLHVLQYIKGTLTKGLFFATLAEAEYCAMASTVCELTWLSYILQEFNVTMLRLIPFFVDNQGLHVWNRAEVLEAVLMRNIVAHHQVALYRIALSFFSHCNLKFCDCISGAWPSDI